MTLSEFDNEFDILYNNIMSNQAPGLNSYEKSVFLTKAQDEIIKNYFNPKGNKYQEGFDDSAKRQIDFSMLIKTVEGQDVEATDTITRFGNTGFYAMPEDIMLYLNGFVDVNREGNFVRLVVLPLKYEDFTVLMSKPYTRPLKNQAWKLITSGTGNSYTYTNYAYIAESLAAELELEYSTIFTLIYRKTLTFTESDSTVWFLKVGDKFLTKTGVLSDTTTNALNIKSIKNQLEAAINIRVNATTTVVQIIPGPNDSISSYLIRYVRKPKPIILENLSAYKVSIGGRKEATSCELDESLHPEILQRAVELAKAAYIGDINTTFEVGKRSE